MIVDHKNLKAPEGSQTDTQGVAASTEAGSVEAATAKFNTPAINAGMELLAKALELKEAEDKGIVDPNASYVATWLEAVKQVRSGVFAATGQVERSLADMTASEARLDALYLQSSACSFRQSGDIKLADELDKRADLVRQIATAKRKQEYASRRAA